MPNINIGWEINPCIGNVGANLYVVAQRPIVVTGLQMCVSMMMSGVQADGSPGYGASNLLAILSWYPTLDPMQQGGQDYMAPIANNDFGPCVTHNPDGIGVYGSIGYSGYLASVILKSTTNQAVCQNVDRCNLSVAVPAGGVILAHIDHQGAGCDVEMQGSIEYVWA